MQRQTLCSLPIIMHPTGGHYLLDDVYTEPTQVDGPFSPAMLRHSVASRLPSLPQTYTRAVLDTNGAFVAACSMGDLSEVHEITTELHSEELHPGFLVRGFVGACKAGYLDVAEYLLRRGLSLQGMGEEGQTLLDSLLFRVLDGAVTDGESGEEEGVRDEKEEEVEEEGEEGGDVTAVAHSFSRSHLYQQARVGRSSAAEDAGRAPSLPPPSDSHEFVAFAQLMASRAMLDASMGLLSRVLTPPHRGTTTAAAAAAPCSGGGGGEGGSEGQDEESPPSQLPAPPSLTLLWLVSRVGCPPSPLRSGDGFSPLHLAACQGLLDETVALLAAGADANAISSDGTTPIGAALQGREGCGGALPLSLATKFTAVVAALSQAGGCKDWREALKSRNDSAKAPLTPLGLGVFVEWGRKGARAVEAFTEATKSGVGSMGGLFWSGQGGTLPQGSGGGVGEEEEEVIEGVALSTNPDGDDDFTVQEGDKSTPLDNSVNPGGSTAHTYTSTHGSVLLTHVEVSRGGGGITIEGERRRNNHKAPPPLPPTLPAKVKPLRSNTAGSIGAKFLTAPGEQ